MTAYAMKLEDLLRAIREGSPLADLPGAFTGTAEVYEPLTKEVGQELQGEAAESISVTVIDAHRVRLDHRPAR